MTELHAGYPQLSRRRLSTLLGFSRSWWYERTQPQAPDAAAIALRDAIEQIVLDFPGYGYRRVTHALRRAGWDINHKRVLRVMREESLLCQLERRFVRTTDAAHAFRTYPNLLTGTVLARPDQAWVAAGGTPRKS